MSYSPDPTSNEQFLDQGGLRSTMRRMALLLMLGALSAAVQAATPITVGQLREYLSSPHTHRQRDEELAERLGGVTLREQLTERSLAELLAQILLGSQTREQLALLAAASVLRDPPPAEQPALPFPGAAEQKQWVDAVVEFASGNLQHLPDFLATRVTRSFEDSPLEAKQRHAPAKMVLHPVGEFRREIAYRNGHEEIDSVTASTTGAGIHNLSSWGEFGPVLTTMLGDGFAASVRFGHWETGPDGNPIAVLRFAVPRSASHYLVDFCCYRKDEDSGWLSFRGTPGYHGDLSFDPRSGHLVRMRLDADLKPDDAVSASGMAVEYGPVQIGGREYICPVKSVAIVIVHDRQAKKVDGVGLVTHLNETRFLNYRKFGSTARVLPGGEAPEW